MKLKYLSRRTKWSIGQILRLLSSINQQQWKLGDDESRKQAFAHVYHLTSTGSQFSTLYSTTTFIRKAKLHLLKREILHQLSMLHFNTVGLFNKLEDGTNLEGSWETDEKLMITIYQQLMYWKGWSIIHIAEQNHNSRVRDPALYVSSHFRFFCCAVSHWGIYAPHATDKEKCCQTTCRHKRKLS